MKVATTRECDECKRVVGAGEELIVLTEMDVITEYWLCRSCVIEAMQLLKITEGDVKRWWAETKSYPALKGPR